MHVIYRATAGGGVVHGTKQPPKASFRYVSGGYDCPVSVDVARLDDLTWAGNYG
jgi:hypothetical protein